MTPRELNTELQRLRHLAKALLASIEALQARAETTSGTIPPPARPTTRLRRSPKGPLSGQSQAVRADDEEPPSTRPGAGNSSSGGVYRQIAPKKR